VTDPLEAIKDEIEQRKGQYDVLIVMSHVGVFFDEKLCQEIPEIDVILGSHTHHHFNHGEVNNGVLMAAAGKYGHYLGEVNLTIENKKVVTKEATLHPVDTLPVVKTHFDEEGKDLMNKAIINKPVSLSSKTNVITKTTYLLAESVYEFTNADCTIINAGLIVNNVESDQLTEYDIHTMLPHPINLVRVRLKGSELKKIILKIQALNNQSMFLLIMGNIFQMYTYLQFLIYRYGYLLFLLYKMWQYDEVSGHLRLKH
jgi:2',3'-cyclic-nucleotide 2'-phosphodiesterase (5'-nucleotidase family)